MRLLFVCSRNRLRSPTAAAVFSAYPGVEAISAGTSPDAENPISADLIAWADVVLAMEKTHRRKLNERFTAELKAKRVVVLDIPDDYGFMDSELVRILKVRVPRCIDLQAVRASPVGKLQQNGV
jgi:predicted protein tyrosine phosphatase